MRLSPQAGRVKLAPFVAALAAALYPALHRLEDDGLPAAEWGTSDTNRRARFYHVTEAGEARLDAESARRRGHARRRARLLPPE